MTHTAIGCPKCGSENVETGSSLEIMIVKHETRIYYDVGHCLDCGQWMIHDGRADAPAQCVTYDELWWWQREGKHDDGSR